jgi:RNA recognition motif-containing protein
VADSNRPGYDLGGDAPAVRPQFPTGRAGAVIVQDLPANASEELIRSLLVNLGEIPPDVIVVNSRAPQRSPASQLHQLFAVFGEIVACTISRDVHGVSRDYGCVQFRHVRDAELAVQGLTNAFVLRALDKATPHSFTNVYIENLLAQTEFGTVVSSLLVTSPDGEPRDFDFCERVDREAAVRALRALNRRVIDDSRFVCDQAIWHAGREGYDFDLDNIDLGDSDREDSDDRLADWQPFEDPRWYTDY